MSKTSGPSAIGSPKAMGLVPSAGLIPPGGATARLLLAVWNADKASAGDPLDEMSAAPAHPSCLVTLTSAMPRSCRLRNRRDRGIGGA